MGYVILFLLNLLAPLAGLAVVLYFFFSSRRNVLKNLKNEMSQRFALRPNTQVFKDYIWLHAASVGETRSIVKTAQMLKDLYSKPVLITTSTAAGRNAALKEPVFDTAVLMPIDFYPFIKKFIKIYNPCSLFIVESDLWPNTVIACGRNNIPVGIINGRISEKSAKRYKFILPLMRLMFNNITFVCAQTEEIKQRYLSLGAAESKIFVTGNIKYDMLTGEPSRTPEVREVLSQLGWDNFKIVTCGSTHDEEEQLIIKAAGALKDVRFIIAPRHLERKKFIIEKLNESKIEYAILSKINRAPQNARILLADTMGWLGALYKAADITFVGGSITKKGGHNFLEAAVLRKPVLFGKYYYNTPDVALALLQGKGGILVGKDNFIEVIEGLVKNPQRLEAASAEAEKTALSFKGATEKTINVVKNYERK